VLSGHVENTLRGGASDEACSKRRATDSSQVPELADEKGH
jgi:hypothetical protein